MFLACDKRGACDIVANRGLGDNGPSTSPKFDLVSVITNFGQQECTDPRDRIFGCLGLVNFQDIPPFAADYEILAEALADWFHLILPQLLHQGFSGLWIICVGDIWV
jgi:hypothetical protein